MLVEPISSKYCNLEANSWLADKSKAITFNAERTREKILTKLEKEKAKVAADNKKAETLAKKNAAAEKRFSKQRDKN